MASKIPDCSICIQRNVTTPSTDWCPICEEALCVNCREHHGFAKLSKDHKVIPISDYNKLPQNIHDIKLYCEDHGDKYQLFCQSHDLPICSKCIEDHAKCGDVIPLDKITENAKKSTSFQYLIQAINDIEENFEQIRKDREKNVNVIEDQKKKCQEDIETIRQKINEHLDKLQADLLDEISRSSDKVLNNMKYLIDDLEERQNKIVESKNLVQNIEAYASDLQTFLGIKVIELEVATEETYLKSISDDGRLDNVSIICEIDKDIQKKTNINTFGSVRINTKPCDVKLLQRKSKEAQVINEPTIKSIHNISCTPSKTFETTGGYPERLLMDIQGCCILSNGQPLFVCYGTDTLRVFTSSGLFDFVVPLKPNSAVNVAIVNDSTVAVTSNCFNYGVSIVDLDKKTITQFITLPGSAYGITITETCLVVCVVGIGIVCINLEDNKLSTINASGIEKCSYIAHHNNKLYYSSPSQNTVTCCTMTGQTMWWYRNKSILVRPSGIKVDRFGNVFVVGRDSFNLVVISADGKDDQQIFKDWALNNPTCLYLCGSTNMANTLLLANRTKCAMLLDVKY